MSNVWDALLRETRTLKRAVEREAEESADRYAALTEKIEAHEKKIRESAANAAKKKSDED